MSIDCIIDPHEFPSAAIVNKSCSAGITARKMPFVRQAILIEGRPQQIIIGSIGNDGFDDIFAPTLDTVARAPEPALQWPSRRIGRATLRPAPNIDNALANF